VGGMDGGLWIVADLVRCSSPDSRWDYDLCGVAIRRRGAVPCFIFVYPHAYTHTRSLSLALTHTHSHSRCTQLKVFLFCLQYIFIFRYF